MNRKNPWLGVRPLILSPEDAEEYQRHRDEAYRLAEIFGSVTVEYEDSGGLTLKCIRAADGTVSVDRIVETPNKTVTIELGLETDAPRRPIVIDPTLRGWSEDEEDDEEVEIEVVNLDHLAVD